MIPRTMVQTKKMILQVEIEIDVPVDIVQEKDRLKAVEDGLGQCISKALYDQGGFVQIKEGWLQDQMKAVIIIRS
jgi:hypothetical protein